jgi:prolyl oligopeptidase
LLVSLAVLGCGAPAAEVAPAQPPAPLPSAPVASASAPVAAPEVPDEDFAYLEEVNGERSLAFAKAHDAVSEKELTGQPGFKSLEQRIFSIYSSKDKIPAPQVIGSNVRNFWTDAEHPRGLWRVTSLAEYRKPKPTWTTLIDVDALGKEEGQSYVWHGASCLPPAYRKCLVSLSKGGGDAAIVREFDAEKRAWVKDGFTLPEAKSRVSWKDENTVFLGTDFGEGSLTKSGYPRLSKEWKRGTPASAATQVFEVKDTDISATCYRSFDHGRNYDFCDRAIDFERSETFLLRGGKLVKIDKPEDADAGTWDDQLFFRLRSPWTVSGKTYDKGSLLVAGLEGFVKGERAIEPLFEPTRETALVGFNGTKTKIFVNTLSDVRNRVMVITRKGKTWEKTPLDERAGAIHVAAFDEDHSDDAWLWLEDFTVPNSLHLWSAKTKKKELVKQNPSYFDATGLDVTQHFATSKDGTKIPYFEVGRKDRSGPVPTIIEAYGGFEIPQTPGYGGSIGAAWLERGGTYVLANLRGGGEYGPAWHEAAMKRSRQAAYDDMAAVAEDLIKRGVATAKTLGTMGGSNGGLLTSVMLTQRPELFGAIVSQVPLTDMRRYHKLLAGASWMSEYGDPDDPKDWEAMAKYSPFHNVKRDAHYPPVLFTTSTKDDRVHPGHARKMVAKLEAMGHSPLYYENIEGGHGGSADIKQAAYVRAMVLTFLGTRLGLK